MLYVLAGTLRTQGVEMGPGDAYVAAAGSVPPSFAERRAGQPTPCSIFKLWHPFRRYLRQGPPAPLVEGMRTHISPWSGEGRGDVRRRR